MAYAAETSVPVVKSRLDIEGLLQRNGATQYLTAHDHEAGRAIVQFKLAERLVRFTVTIPPMTDGRRRRGRSPADRQAQVERQRWRALWLILKAKLESLESGIETFEQSFLAHVVLDNDRTIGEILIPRLQAGRLALPPAAEDP
jgi:hypothetical protein